MVAAAAVGGGGGGVEVGGGVGGGVGVGGVGVGVGAHTTRIPRMSTKSSRCDADRRKTSYLWVVKMDTRIGRSARKGASNHTLW